MLQRYLRTEHGFAGEIQLREIGVAGFCISLQ